MKIFLLFLLGSALTSRVQPNLPKFSCSFAPSFRDAFQVLKGDNNQKSFEHLLPQPAEEEGGEDMELVIMNQTLGFGFATSTVDKDPYSILHCVGGKCDPKTMKRSTMKGKRFKKIDAIQTPGEAQKYVAKTAAYKAIFDKAKGNAQILPEFQGCNYVELDAKSSELEFSNDMEDETLPSEEDLQLVDDTTDSVLAQKYQEDEEEEMTAEQWEKVMSKKRFPCPKFKWLSPKLRSKTDFPSIFSSTSHWCFLSRPPSGNTPLATRPKTCGQR